MVTSAYPFILKGVGLPKKKLRTIAEILRDAGYSTGGWSPNPYISQAYNYHRGFKTFMDPENWSRASEKVRLRILKTVRRWSGLHHLLRILNNNLLGGTFSFVQWDAELILDRVTEWIRDEKRVFPFFAWVHFNDVHHPWFPRKTYSAQLGAEYVSPRRAKSLVNKLSKDPDHVWRNITQDEMRVVIDLYDAAIRYTDEMIGRFISSSIDLDETIVIITADHGEEFGEHGGFHRNKPYNEMLQVPLIIAGPNVPQGRIIDKQVSLIDLAPTITDLCSLEASQIFQGQSLVSTMNEKEANRVCLSYYDRHLVDGPSAPEGEAFAIHRGDWKFISREGGDELYCLESDPNEEINLVQDRPELAQSLQNRLKEEISKYQMEPIVLDEVPLDDFEAIEDRLRALGYVE